VRTKLDTLLRDALARTLGEPVRELIGADLLVERTRDRRHGDFSSNVALRLAKPLGRAPRDLADALLGALSAPGFLERAEVAGPGFVNFTLSPEAYREELRTIITAGPDYGRSESGAGRRVLVEYVSANPTGPLHVGHGRLAAYGSCLAKILRATGHAVDEEYYVNDAGRQMDILAASVWLRYADPRLGDLPFPANAYQGGYVREIAATLRQSRGEALLGDPGPGPAREVLARPDLDAEQRLDLLIETIKRNIGETEFREVLKAALTSVLGDIERDLAEFGVTPQRWYSERTLTDGGAVERALELLDARGMLYRKDGATWFKSSEFGDEKDRVVIRENGATTYFASDIAYHLEKRARGYDHLLDVLGADHHGYVGRVRAGLEAAAQDGDALEVRLVQFVVLYRGQAKVQMSTRSGEYVTLRELREEVGNDAAHFFYVSRSNDQHLEFDLDLAKSRSNENPVYYVQYAHARVASMMRRLQEEGDSHDPAAAGLSRLVEEQEQALVVSLTRYPEIVQLAADNRAPQHLVHYLREIAAEFHSYYNAHRILVEDEHLRSGRLTLALAVQQVIRNGLTLLGVSAPQSM
jgi:arginyl-tRNA synthetase